ncbi:hypothetical protein SLE2022_399000 [Rubroshorea leprosula]
MESSVVVTAIAMSITTAFLSCLLWHKENYLPFTSNKKKKRKKPRNGVIDAIGNTPLIRLNSLSQAIGCEILRKCEFLNPGGSVKDRVAVQIIKEALESGKLASGGVVAEGSAGSTAISLATVSPPLAANVMLSSQMMLLLKSLKYLKPWVLLSKR